MHSEVQIAVNFVLSFLYNKLPRRRVNQFGEELELVLKSKFEDHWHPETPFKGSQFRCLRFSRPLDPFVFDLSAQRSGLALVDIQEHLPTEMTIWIDPGEVSYRLGENEAVKTLFSRKVSPTNNSNPQIQAGNSLSSSPDKSDESSETSCRNELITTTIDNTNNNTNSSTNNTPNNNNWKSGQLNPNAPSFTPMMHSRPQIAPQTQTYTAADFAATKFGSTKRRVNNIKKTKPIELNGGYGGRPGKMNKHSFGVPPLIEPFKIQNFNNNNNINNNNNNMNNPMIKSPNSGFFDSYDWRNLQDSAQNPSQNNQNNDRQHHLQQQQQQQQNQQQNQKEMNIWSMNEAESNLFNSSFLDRYLPREHNFRASMAAVENVSLSKNNLQQHHQNQHQNSNQQQSQNQQQTQQNNQQSNHHNRWDDMFNSTAMDIGFNFKPSPVESSASFLTTSGSGTELSGYYSSSSCTLSSLSSPSLASTDFSLHLINEFDNLSLNSTSSSSIGSSISSSYVN